MSANLRLWNVYSTIYVIIQSAVTDKINKTFCYIFCSSIIFKCCKFCCKSRITKTREKAGKFTTATSSANWKPRFEIDTATNKFRRDVCQSGEEKT